MQRVSAEHREEDSIEILRAVVEPKLALFEVSDHVGAPDASPLHDPCLGCAPEALDAVDVADRGGKDVGVVAHTNVLLAAEVDQTVIGAPLVGVPHALEGDMAADYDYCRARAEGNPSGDAVVAGPAQF